ncbi:MAG: hypothetical protein ACYDHH_00805 [Solirubrobacteraceae bacterium]
MTLTPHNAAKPQPKRPTLHKETMRDLDPDPSLAQDIKGGQPIATGYSCG